MYPQALEKSLQSLRLILVDALPPPKHNETSLYPATPAFLYRALAASADRFLEVFPCLDSRFRGVGRFNRELSGVLSVQPLPAELHRLRTNDAANGSSAQKVIQNIETNVPTGSTHCDE